MKGCCADNVFNNINAFIEEICESFQMESIHKLNTFTRISIGE
jgi:hypothetical protein